MIGEKIKQLRIEKGLKQSELAEKAGISRVSVGFYERNERQPTIEIAIRIAHALGVSINCLSRLDESPILSSWHFQACDDIFKKGLDRFTKEETKDIINLIKAFDKPSEQLFKEQVAYKNKANYLEHLIKITNALNDKGVLKVIQYVTDISRLPDYREGEPNAPQDEHND